MGFDIGYFNDIARGRLLLEKGQSLGWPWKFRCAGLNAKGAKGATVRHGFVVALVARECRRSGKSVPQRLKPHCFRGIYGMAEAVPLTNTKSCNF